MGITLKSSLREQIHRVLIEEVPGANDENVANALNRIMEAVDPFESAAAYVLERYDRTFAELAK